MQKRGFTLIELLVVIGIISLLMTISLPAISMVRQKAQGVACRANLHSLAIAFSMYIDDNRQKMPIACAMPSIQNGPALIDSIEDYIAGPKTLLCPGDTGHKYFNSEQTSYEYNQRFSGKVVSKTFLVARFGEKNVHVLRDLTAFHGKAGKPYSCNYLYADGHIGDNSKQN